MKTMMNTFAAVLILGSASTALAHGYRFKGSVGSNAQIFAEALLTQKSQVDGIDTSVTEKGLRVFREDETGAIECFKAEAYICTAIQKHGRPLEPISDYTLGLYQTLVEGEAGNNASLVFNYMKSLAMTDSQVAVRQITDTRLQLKHKDQSSTLECVRDTQSGVAIFRCDIQDDF